MSQIENLQGIVRKLSQERVCITGEVENLQLTECKNVNDLVYGAWTSLILVAGSSFKLIFKAHFNCREIRSLLSRINSVPFENISDDAAMDHMREFCNMIAGGVKTSFSNLNSACGISLPLVIAGFDEILYKAQSKIGTLQDIWCLDWGSGSLTCSSSLDVFDSAVLEALAFDTVVTKAEDDDDAFL